MGRPRFTGYVPASHRWLAELFTAMREVGAPASEAVVCSGELSLRLGSDRSGGLTLKTRPLGQGETPCFARTSRFAVGFEGCSDLSQPQREGVERFVRLLARLERSIDKALAGFASIGDHTPEPVDQLPRLFPFLTIERSTSDRGQTLEVLLRATPRCNQACPFCSAPDTIDPDPGALRAGIAAVARRLPGAMLTFSGGEPTLRSDFVDVLRHALSRPAISAVQVQTNAVRFAAGLEPRDLEPSDRLSFFVSLHALDPAIYDACTGSRGQLEKAVAGTRRLLEAGHPVTLNTVVNRLNIDHVDAFIAALPEVFPHSNTPLLHFSVLICPESNPDAAAFLVPYAELAEVLRSAARQARRLGLQADSLLSSTHASMPACAVPEERRGSGRRRLQIEDRDTGYETRNSPWVKAGSCTRCREDRHCLGVPQAYARRFGLDELIPLEEPDTLSG